MKLVSPPAGSTCPSPSDAFPPARSLQNKSVLCINKAPRGADEKSSARELHECSFFYENKHRRFFFPPKPLGPGKDFSIWPLSFPLPPPGSRISVAERCLPFLSPLQGAFGLKSQSFSLRENSGCQRRSLVQPRPAAWHMSTVAGRGVPTGGQSTVTPPEPPLPRCPGLAEPSLPPAPCALPRLPAALKFPRRTKQKREEKAFHHRSREPTYKNLTLPLPGSLAALEGFRHSPCGLREPGRAGERREPTRSPTIPGSPGSPRHGSPP